MAARRALRDAKKAADREAEAAAHGRGRSQAGAWRARSGVVGRRHAITANRANALNFAKFVGSVPPNQKSGNVEMPTAAPDPRSSFAVMDQAVMSEADFHKAVAPQGDTRRKKHNAFVFVHGFNSNFQESLFRLAQLHQNRRDSDPVLLAIARSGSCL
jgi:esterase/lipase superfamily enzyme